MQAFRVDESSPLAPRGASSGALDAENDFGIAAPAAASRRRRTRLQLLWLASAVAISSVLSIAALSLAVANKHRISEAAAEEAAGGWGPIERIAFGSCTAYDLRPQRVWTEGVIPANPDAWVWLGDMVYMDEPLVDCAAVPGFPECNCSATFMRRPPFQCFAGDVVHARARVEHQLASPEYRAFINFMCPPPNDDVTGSPSHSSGHPPDGSDARQCPRPIFGVWDDHDFGWNNGDGRNPVKLEIKNLYLDALGAPQSSPRRGAVTGLQTHYTLPSGPASASASVLGPRSSRSSRSSKVQSDLASDGIDLILLDGRYERETLPCGARREWCASLLASPSYGPGDGEWQFCQDLLVTGGVGGVGSCCRKDEEWSAWCAKPEARQHARWAALCDPTSSDFANQPLVLDADNATVIAGGFEAAWAARQGPLWHRLVEGAASPVCEMLGANQRRWLRETLAASTAPLKLVGSGSVLAGSIGQPQANGTSQCDGDDWACWQRAQVNLLHTLANASGCVVMLTGDYHYSDIKVIQPGAPPGTNYSDFLQTPGLRKPVWQVMASGLTRSTARNEAAACRGSWLEDVAGLRPLGRCSYTPQPAFGMVEVDWPKRHVILSIRDAASGDIALGKDGVRQEVTLDLDTCLRVR